MTAVAVLVPVMNRPHRVEPLLESLAASAGRGERLRPVFVCSPDDPDELAACRASDADVIVTTWPGGSPADWARKQNLGFRETDEEWKLLAADDLCFHPGWLRACLEASRRAGGACVVGSNDLGNARVMRGHHSTHPLVHADYLECGTVDEQGKIVHEGYQHQFCDDELVQTAIWRGTWAHAADAVIEHLHPDWGKGEPDAVYELGQRGFWQDKALYESRRHLWERETRTGTW